MLTWPTKQQIDAHKHLGDENSAHGSTAVGKYRGLQNIYSRVSQKENNIMENDNREFN
jgi:hypothetical protein